MVALLRRYLRPYRGRVAAVVALLLVQAIGQLWLPSLNADIINNGVLTGDTAYITRVGGLMLLVTLVVGAAAVATAYLGASTAMAWAATCGPRSSAGCSASRCARSTTSGRRR